MASKRFRLDGKCLLLFVLLWAMLIQIVVAQSDGAAPSSDNGARAQLSVDDLRKVFDRLITGSDGGDRKAFTRFGRLYQSLY